MNFSSQIDENVRKAMDIDLIGTGKYVNQNLKAVFGKPVS